MKKTNKTARKLGILFALLGALTLAGCAASDTDASRSKTDGSSPTGPTSNSSNSNSNSNKGAKDRKLDGLFEYTLIEEENTVLLTKYIGDSETVTVYGSYKIGGKEYKTRLQDGVGGNVKTSPFRDNTTVKSLIFVDGVKLNNCSNYYRK